MTIIKQVRTILTDESEDLPHLLMQAQLDAGLDLQGCDFAGIDFGALTTDVLNLRNCDLTSADLSKVHVRQLLTDGASIAGTLFPPEHARATRLAHLSARQRFDAIKMMALAIHRFHVPALVPERIFENVSEKRPVFASYRSFTEHDIFVRQIGRQIGESIGTALPEQFSGAIDDESSLTVIVNVRGPVGAISASPDELDRAFLDVFDEFTLAPGAHGRGAVTFDRKTPILGSQRAGEAINARRREFVQALERASRHSLNVFLFSRIPSILKRARRGHRTIKSPPTCGRANAVIDPRASGRRIGSTTRKALPEGLHD